MTPSKAMIPVYHTLGCGLNKQLMRTARGSQSSNKVYSAIHGSAGTAETAQEALIPVLAPTCHQDCNTAHLCYAGELQSQVIAKSARANTEQRAQCT